tara:strand:- start:1079 stop:1969 length:891 start_codon:yes stop_codon:yes gene_type:complete
MAFYKHDKEMSSLIDSSINALNKELRPNIAGNIAVTWICYSKQYPSPLSGRGASWRGRELIYPASIVKIFYAVAIESWLQDDLLIENSELRRAVSDMIRDSNNDATGFIIDLLTATTSGPSLIGPSWEIWKEQRNSINKWIQSFEWEEFNNINCSQKTWNEGPYGREKDFYGKGFSNRNALTTNATARILESIMTSNIISPISCKRIKNLLSRSLDLDEREKNIENQIDGFIGDSLPKGSKIWSKAGLMSQARHDAAWFEIPNKNPMLLIIFSQGKKNATDKSLLPLIASKLINYT